MLVTFFFMILPAYFFDPNNFVIDPSSWHLNHFVMSLQRLNQQKPAVEKEYANCKQIFLKLKCFQLHIISTDRLFFCFTKIL